MYYYVALFALLYLLIAYFAVRYALGLMFLCGVGAFAEDDDYREEIRQYVRARLVPGVACMVYALPVFAVLGAVARVPGGQYCVDNIYSAITH
jgi:hypothetical protein